MAQTGVHFLREQPLWRLLFSAPAAAPVLDLPNWTGEVATSAIAPLRHLSGDQSVGELRDLFGPRARGRSVAELSGPRRSGRIAQPRGDQLRSLQMGCLRQASQTRKAP